MGAADKCLNLTMLSAQGLKDVYTFGTMSPYAKAWIHPSAKQRTPVAANAGCTPVWGHKIHLSLPPSALREEKLSLTIQIWNQGSASDTLVGSANLPLCDLLTSTKPNGLEFMACQLMRPSGRVQGVVNFSMEISDNNTAPACTSPKESRENSASSSSAVPGPLTTKEGLRGNEEWSEVQDIPPIDNQTTSSTELKLQMKSSVLQFEKTFEAAPDPLGTGHGFCTSSDPRGRLIKPVTRIFSAPDALDLPQVEGHSLGDVHSSSNGDGGARGPQNSLPGFGGLMFGGVIGSLLMGESLNVRNEGSGNPAESEQGHGGSSEGVPQP